MKHDVTSPRSPPAAEVAPVYYNARVATMLALLGACAPSKDEGPGHAASYGVRVDTSDVIPTVATVSWTAENAATTWVEYGLDGAFDQATPELAATGSQHHRTLLGLKAGYTYDLRAVTVTTDGRTLLSDPSSVTLAPPPAEMTRLTVSDHDEQAAAPGGFILTALLEPDEAWVVILDRDGDYVWYRRADDGLGVVSTRFDPARESVVWGQHDIAQESDKGGIARVRLDGTEETITRSFQAHHDFTVLPDGSYAFISIDSQYVEIDGETTYVAADRILETSERASEPDDTVEVFSMFTDYRELWNPCSHFDDPVFGTLARDFSHGNSLLYSADRDAYALMSKNLDNILVIDRQSGEVLYEIGGLYGAIATEDSSDMWRHGHYSQQWDGGLTVFDNNYHSEDPASRANEYALDLEAGTLELVWTYTSEGGRFNALLGDVKRLDDTYLVSWTELGMLTEVDEDGRVVWQAQAELGTGFGRVTWVPSLYELPEVESF